MSRGAALGVALAFVVSGCAAAPVAPAASASVPAARAASAPARAPDGWRTIARDRDGYRVDLPSEPEAIQDGLRAHEGDAHYDVVRIVLDDGAVATDDVLSRELAQLERIDAQTHGHASGQPWLTAEGLDESGAQTFLHAVGAGGSVFLLVVEAGRQPIDRAHVERFFQSFRVQAPWRIHTSVEGRFTVAVPALAAVTPFRQGPAGAGVQGPLFQLGGEHELTLSVMWSRIAPEVMRTRSVADLLEASTNAFAQKEGVVIEHLAEVERDGIPGRELEAKSGQDVWVRMRVFVDGSRCYVVVASSLSREDLQQETVARFFESVRMAGRP